MATSPEEAEIVLNSRPDTLYTTGFKQGGEGEGRFFNIVTLDDGSERAELALTSRIKITVVFIKKKNDIESVDIAKWRYRKDRGWREDKAERVRLAPVTMAKVARLLQFLAELDLAGIHDRKIRLAEDTLPALDPSTRKKLKTLLAQKDGLEIVDEVLRSGAISTRDIVNVGYRKAQLGVFEQLLKDREFFETFRTERGVKHAGDEAVWQAFFEANSWIFGYGLNYIWCTGLPNMKLEQVVRGHDFTTAGKRTDALLRTSAHLSQFVLVELKTPQTHLIGSEPRPGVWSPSADLVAAVAQIQKTVSQFKKTYFGKVELAQNDGEPLGLDVYNYAPKSFLLVGRLDQFITANGVNQEKLASFQLFRRSLSDPEIITFDELFARAKAIVEHSEREGTLSVPSTPATQRK